MNAKTIESLTAFFKKEFSEKIVEKLTEGHGLSHFNVNPFTLIALSSGIFGKATSENMAKSLLYPRVFGTSIATTLGNALQKLCVTHLGARASSTKGMDIEFVDKIENRPILMQLKSGPNTINADSVPVILDKMRDAHRLLIRNMAGMNLPTFAVGVTYGSLKEISGHYKKIAASSVGAQMSIPIYIGQDFWYRLTGEKRFYTELITLFVDLFDKEDYRSLLNEDLKDLSRQIEDKYFTDGRFDIKKV